MTTSQALHQQLIQLDQRGYKAYKQIQGTYYFSGFTLFIDYVQGDPFASPSRLRVQVPQSNRDGSTGASFPANLYSSRCREIALRDYLTRQFDRIARTLREKWGSGNSGLIAIASTGQQVLERTSVFVTSDWVEARFVVGLPARGRQILGREAAALLCEDLPQIVERSLRYSSLNQPELQHHIEVVEDTDWLREQLATQGLVAFIPDGAILPRQSGVDDRPLAHHASPFQSPETLRVQFERPNQGQITGMGIPVGITLIVGGGYHGKSTLLRAIALGVYNHIPGDGREWLVTNSTAVKIRAEDGRSVVGVNISPFINHLPQGRSTTDFSTANASGSTSQAANIMEALEVGAKVLLVDEDTSATNFMIRDRRMQALITKDREPITPFIDKIRQLYHEYGVSTILVMGGSGDYFDVADTVIAMSEFQPQEMTAQARAIAAQFVTHRTAEGGDRFGALTSRIPITGSLDDSDCGYSTRERASQRSPRLKVREGDELVLGAEAIDVSAIEQLIDAAQLRAIGTAIAYLQQDYLNGRHSLTELIDIVMQDIAVSQWEGVAPFPSGDLATFRPLELAAVLNRMRSLGVKVSRE
ncbi:ABC-ATPase domain-containing protein [Oscillatoria sp. FACHB-1407]|uniref:ABC-ATPase domain-containing protein n=1 Tax=Oscillatoria sp. FACHB-1407 TaxID=2692847 RepID=UPI001682272A|nr:ABC-ATPase domain-containing protein [Oscillatoria sp. FACHB-1407]MBD2462848.1 ABC-ATPase domain-containing protein [Oscillatoria sp. FACHB-1407]